MTTYELTVCRDGVEVEGGSFPHSGQTVAAVQTAVALKVAHPDSVVTILVTEQ